MLEVPDSLQLSSIFKLGPNFLLKRWSGISSFLHFRWMMRIVSVDGGYVCCRTSEFVIISCHLALVISLRAVLQKMMNCHLSNVRGDKCHHRLLPSSLCYTCVILVMACMESEHLFKLMTGIILLTAWVLSLSYLLLYFVLVMSCDMLVSSCGSSPAFHVSELACLVSVVPSCCALSSDKIQNY